MFCGFSSFHCTLRDISSFDADELATVLSTKHAVWHRPCFLNVGSTKVKRAQKKHATTIDACSPVKTRRLSLETDGQGTNVAGQTESTNATPRALCIICGERGGNSLRRASTLGLDEKVRNCAITCGDKALIARLSGGDLIAGDAVYHLNCLVKLYRKCETVKNDIDGNDNLTNKTAKAQAFRDLVEYVESHRESDIPFFQMSELCNLYSSRLVSLGLDCYVHSTRLRESLLSAIPDLREVKRGIGKTVDLTFEKNLTAALDLLAEQSISDDMRDIQSCKNIKKIHVC